MDVITYALLRKIEQSGSSGAPGKSANEIGAEMSRDVIDSYSCISSLIEDAAHDAQENGEDYYEAYENAILEELSWEVFELKDDAPESIKIDENYEDFLKKWRK